MEVRLLSTEQLAQLERTAARGCARATINSAKGRQLLVIQTSHGWACVDMLCHHMGASLAAGELVDIEDEPHIVCPSHRRLIKLSTGELVHQQLEAGGVTCFKSAGAKQRTHAVSLKADGLWAVITQPDDADGLELASDKYNRPSAPSAPSRLGFQVRKKQATAAVAAKLACVTVACAAAAPPESIDVSRGTENECENECANDYVSQPETAPAVQRAPQPRKRTIRDYFNGNEEQPAQSQMLAHEMDIG